MKIAIASSGLGHIYRGMEAWAQDLAEALFEKGVDVTLFRGAGPKKNEYDLVLPTLKRNKMPAKLIAKITSKGGWRIGLGAPHAVESFVFGLQLLWHLRRDYDLVHVQQGSLGLFLMRMRKLRILRIPVILANGQIANWEFTSNFEYVQHLSPFKELGKEGGCLLKSDKKTFIIPNFVDTQEFIPRDREKARKKLGLPEKALIILTVGALNKHHKRMHYFINEMATLLGRVSRPLHFVIAGASDPEAQTILDLGKSELKTHLTVFLDVPREEIADLYNASNIFVLCSLREAFGIVIIEAMSCGVPVICHEFPIIKWVVQEGGHCIDLSKPDALAGVLVDYCKHPEILNEEGKVVRKRVLREFSKEIVIHETIQMYEDILKNHSKKPSK
jgi:glycosyltransferase involved in cell wall biosynthesis